MLLTLIIILLILINVYFGFRDGFVNEFIRIVSYLVAWLIALRFAHPFGMVLNRFLGVDSMLITGLSFLIILIGTVIVLKSIGRMINRITEFPVIHQVNALSGAVVGALVGYLIVVILLNVGLALPSAWLQNEYIHSPVAMRIVNRTPGMNTHSINEWLK